MDNAKLRQGVIDTYGQQVFDNIKMLMVRIESNYNNHFKNLTALHMILKIEDWCNEFSNISYKMLLQAYRDYRSVNEAHPPSIASINKIIYRMINEDVGSAEDSFNNMYKLVSRCGSDEFGYNKALDYMSDMEKQVINSTYWKSLGMSEDPRGVLLAEYQKKYNSKKESITRNDRLALPHLDSKNILEKISKRKLLK